jgi:acyl-coenzyme A thioesterase PaaI-like protein
MIGSSFTTTAMPAVTAIRFVLGFMLGSMTSSAADQAAYASVESRS